MPFGQLNKAQLKALVPLVRGKVIHDLGAGDLGLALELLNLGASKVIAIDKEYYNFNGVPPEIDSGVNTSRTCKRKSTSPLLVGPPIMTTAC